MASVTIIHNAATLQVSGTFFGGYAHSMDEPGAPDVFEVAAVSDSGVDVMHLHDDADLEDIAGLALAAYQQEQADLDQQIAESSRDWDADREDRNTLAAMEDQQLARHFGEVLA